METKQPVFKSPLSALGLIVGVSLVLSASIAAYTFYRVQLYGGSLSVTGSAKTEVTSDQAKWTVALSRQVYASQIKDGYDMLAGDLAQFQKFLSDNNIDPKSVTVSPVATDEVYQYMKDGSQPVEKQYNLHQTLTLASGDVQGVAALAQNASSLARNGVIFQSQGVEYYYSKLPELRVSLLSDAIRDAKARAEKLAEPSGQSVGPLRSASLGVVQVLAPNSVDISDYGSYDTSNIEKEVMVTVRASFAIR